MFVLTQTSCSKGYLITYFESSLRERSFVSQSTTTETICFRWRWDHTHETVPSFLCSLFMETEHGYDVEKIVIKSSSLYLVAKWVALLDRFLCEYFRFLWTKSILQSNKIETKMHVNPAIFIVLKCIQVSQTSHNSRDSYIVFNINQTATTLEQRYQSSCCLSTQWQHASTRLSTSIHKCSSDPPLIMTTELSSKLLLMDRTQASKT